MKNIDKILNNYFEGLTSLDEEKLLRHYFSQTNIAERHKIYIPLFQYFSEQIDKHEIKEQPIAKPKRRHAIAPYISIAASMLILISVGLTFFAKSDQATQSIVFIDGKQISDQNIIFNQSLKSVDEATQIDYELLDSQIDILNSFTQ